MGMWDHSLASISGSGIWHCHELWCRSKTWLGSLPCCGCGRPAAAALIWPPAWELPNAAGAALKRKKKKTYLGKKKSRTYGCVNNFCTTSGICTVIPFHIVIVSFSFLNSLPPTITWHIFLLQEAVSSYQRSCKCPSLLLSFPFQELDTPHLEEYPRSFY